MVVACTGWSQGLDFGGTTLSPPNTGLVLEQGKPGQVLCEEAFLGAYLWC